MSKILVTGASGMLGQDLCPILENNGHDVIRTNSKSMNITESAIVNTEICRHSPDIIIHCAAYTDVDRAETDFENAKLINSTGTENIAKICSQKDIPLVYISTDYVFDGKKQTPYTVQDIPNPINKYGMTKYFGETAVKKYCSKYFIVRTSWLYGIYGKNFVETMLSQLSKPELKVVNDQTGCPTWTVELSNIIVKLMETQHYGIHHVCGGGFTTWYGFAKEIFKQCGIEVNLSPCTTEEFSRPAKRPVYSVMDNSGLCEDWKISLGRYLKTKERMNN